MKQLNLLEKITTPSVGKVKNDRQLELLKDPFEIGDRFFKVKEGFNSALDIRLTTRAVEGQKGITEKLWTQGSNFSFAAGDVLHTAGDQLTVQVESAVPVMAAAGDEIRFAGRVKCRIFKKDAEGRTVLFGTSTVITQDDFVKVLLCGECDSLSFRLA